MVTLTQTESFATPRATQIARIIHKRRPLAQKIEVVENNLKSLYGVLKQLESQREHLITQINDPGTTIQLQDISFSKIQNNINTELAELNKLKSRLFRSTLNIGVVGRARQGKSRLLQSLTGLSASEIPDGDDQHCTGVRSNIHHNPETDTYAEVWFHTEHSFLDEVIAPYYEQLNLTPKPRSIQEFADSPLPALPNELAQRQALAEAKYTHLCKYHLYLAQYRHFLNESSPRRIPKHEIREYVAQDTTDRQRIYFNYLAVREVKIICSFPNADIGQIALVDMPGLGDTGIGDAERMINALGQEIDLVLFVRMPKSTGDFWAREDLELYDMANSALVELPIQEWSFMVLNHISETSGRDNNRRNCDSLAATIAEKGMNFQDVIIANCANPEESQTEILDRVLNYLTQRIEILDRQYASVCQERLTQLQRLILDELGKAKGSWGHSQTDNWLPQFIMLFEKLWKNLTRELEKLISLMISERDIEDKGFKAAVEKAIENCRSNPGIPTIEEIEQKRACEGSYDAAYAQCLHEVRTHLSKQFLSLDEALKESLETAKSYVVDVLVNHGQLEKLAQGKGGEFLKQLTEKIPANLSGLRLGFETLATFDLQYRGLIQHRIRKYLDVLTPDRTPYNLTGGFFDKTLDIKTFQVHGGSPNAEKILRNLRKAQLEALDNCEKELKTVLKEPSQAGFAIVEEFVDRVLRAEGVRTEWQIFLQEVASDVWADEFRSTVSHSQLKQDWMRLVQQAERNNQSENFQFLR